MEAATISSPQRKLNVVPVQKSLSLPSYAKAGGEGIDHRIIFAALEQREKVRRKSKIFTREKTARQNIFCLPISSGNKCRETSLSSDTSCSSLEYQKPKSSSNPKKDEKHQQTSSKVPTTTIVNELSIAKTNQPEVKSNPSPKDEATKTVDPEPPDSQRDSLKMEHRVAKGHRSPSDTLLKPHVNSSDSMERSSRSSNDSLSRKERLVAIKAKVEAAREKYGDTSSEDENQSAITRYNSDGVIHRSVREVKSRSYRLEKRFRRRSQDEYALKKLNRRNNLSLCLNSLEDGIKLDLDRHTITFDDGQTIECKTDFCPSPNFLDFTKKNYFSDFPSKENVSVQTRVRHIEEEERKRRNSSDFRDKTKISPRQSPQNTENSSPFSTQRRNVFSNQNALGSLDAEKNSPGPEALHCHSPVGRAPTPPPRSPKSITFVNKAYMQHQNTYLNHDGHSLERKPYFHPNIPVTAQTKCTDKINLKCEIASSSSKTCLDILEDAVDKRKMRELFNSRRKTCGYFDYADNFAFKELNSTSCKVPSSNSPITVSNGNASQSKSVDGKGYFSGSDTQCSVEDTKRSWKSNWEETEKRQEFMFNSLESKKKAMSPSWMKWTGMSSQNEHCLCQITPGNRVMCTCNSSGKNIGNKLTTSTSASNNSEILSKHPNDAHQPCRLSKSEMNIAYSDQSKSNIHNSNSGNLLPDLQTFNVKSSKEKLGTNDQVEKLSATANLDSAMEELESVYRSLKFSSDNLSEKNSASNVSLNDLNAETPQVSSFNHKSGIEFHFKGSSFQENNLNVHNSKSNSMKPATDKKPLEFLKLSVYSPPPDTVTSPKTPETENLCIDELFNDLTRQLDIEQKILRESRNSRQENRPLDLQIDKWDKWDQKRMTPLESIVSIRKELYDNLQKSSKDNLRSHNPVSKVPNRTEDLQLEMARKKYKAVRSLSENISYLMAAANPNTELVRKSPIEKNEPSSRNMETVMMGRSSPKRYENVVLEPLKIETKTKASLNHPIVPKRTFTQKKPLAEEIRQIRVSMDSNSPESTAVYKMRQYGEYPRLTSAVCRPQASSPKSESPARILPPSNISSVPKDTVDILDENGLEKLLNTLLNDFPETKQSSLMLSKDEAPSTPTSATSSAGNCDHVKYKRNILPSKMDAYMAATAKSQIPTTECSQRLKSEEIAQVKNDFRQNSAHLNQMSFIPVFANKTVCHKFPKSKDEYENVSENAGNPRKVLATYSPPVRPRCPGNSDMLAARIAKTHMRRRSVGFEDMTSFHYGHNFTNDRRFQGSMHNSNISQSSENHGTVLQSDNAQPVGKFNQSENMCYSSWNHNAQLTSSENANDHLPQRTERSLQQYKDKSSKRKSSLNRMDFINFPAPNAGVTQYHSDISQQKNSSSDEGSECRFRMKKAESPSGTTKRKHSTASLNHASPKSEVKTREVTLRNSSPSKMKSNVLPRSSQGSLPNPRQIRWKQSQTIRFSQKLSHSAGELESLTDCSEVPSRNKTYSSAQEFDEQECSRVSFTSGTSSRILARNSFQKLSPKYLRKNEITSKHTCDNTSQIDNKNESTNDNSILLSKQNNDSDNLVLFNKGTNESIQSVDQIGNISNKIYPEQNGSRDSKNSDVKLDCDDLKLCDDAEVETSATKLGSLEITESNSKNMDVYLSADENGEAGVSDTEKRPNSILRKKSFDERKELHSILKPTPEDKFSKTPPSILKHRESSEEKDTWQPNDLHSILKKSTSEDESYNSGPDIRPILKLSTDEDSSSGAVRPRPILKKRTSFSDECSYVSFPSGELKPILKKKTPLSSEEQPRPILKSRRKSEDTRSTVSEVITSRPRAYSADMGVKMSHENQTDNSNVKKDFHKLDSHDL